MVLADATILDDRGVPVMCEHGDAPASAFWTDTLGTQHLACLQHAPWVYNPVSGPQQVIYPGTGG